MQPIDDVIDLLVVGGGTAGIVGARTAARLGARTVLVERDRTGGDCLWTGCVPSKTLLSAAARSAAERAMTGGGTDFAAVRARIAEAVATIEPDDSPESLEDAGVTVLSGTARFTAPGEADVDGRTVRFRQALVATGSTPAVPVVPGLQEARTVTSETVWDLEELPGRLAVQQGLSTRDLSDVTHPYPTYNDALWNAAIAHARGGLDSPVAGAAVQALLHLNRWRVQRSSR